MKQTTEFSNLPSPLRYIHSWHYDMLVNQGRSQFYNDLIQAHCRDKIVLEIGTGSGLMAVLAIQHGARQVICCEENPLLAMAAQQLFKRLGVQDKITLFTKNSNDIGTDEIPKVDVVLHELFGSDPFEEVMIPSLRDARRFMKEDAIFLPEKIQLIYKPLARRPLPEKLYFGNIELLEMTELINQVHPGLRIKNATDTAAPFFKLPVVSVQQLINEPYHFVEHQEALRRVDAVEVSFNILHAESCLQAAGFEVPTGRIHWYPLVFYKLDTASDRLEFWLRDETKLHVE